MSCLIKMYRDLLIGNGLDEDGAEKYKMQNLKIRLERHYDNKILFYSQYHRNKSEQVSKYLFATKVKELQLNNKVWGKKKKP